MNIFTSRLSTNASKTKKPNFLLCFSFSSLFISKSCRLKCLCGNAIYLEILAKLWSGKVKAQLLQKTKRTKKGASKSREEEAKTIVVVPLFLQQHLLQAKLFYASLRNSICSFFSFFAEKRKTVSIYFCEKWMCVLPKYKRRLGRTK